MNWWDRKQNSFAETGTSTYNRCDMTQCTQRVTHHVSSHHEDDSHISPLTNIIFIEMLFYPVEGVKKKTES